MTAKKDRTQEKIAQERVRKIRSLKTIIDFTVATAGNDGKWHDLDSFSFRVRKNFSMGGGNTVEVRYHPKESQGAEKIPQVLKAWWQFDTEKCQSDTFDPDQQWQQELLKFIERRKKPVVGAHRAALVPKKEPGTKFVEEMRERHRIEKDKKALRDEAGGQRLLLSLNRLLLGNPK